MCSSVAIIISLFVPGSLPTLTQEWWIYETHSTNPKPLYETKIGDEWLEYVYYGPNRGGETSIEYKRMNENKKVETYKIESLGTMERPKWDDYLHTIGHQSYGMDKDNVGCYNNSTHSFCIERFVITVFVSLILVFCLFFLFRWINSKDEFVITNKRVVAKAGVIRRIAFELLIEQMESIEVHQGIIGRILNYGTLMPCGIGASKVRIPFVVNPFEFRQHFYDLKKPQNN